MRIVQLGKYYPPHRGGIERVVEGLSRGLAQRGHEVTVVVSSDGRDHADETLDGVRVIRVAQGALVRSQPVNFGLSRLLSALAFDVLHVHTPNPLGALAALVAVGRRRLVVSHHSDIVQQRLLGGLGNLAHAALYARASAIVAPTPLHVRHSPLLGHFAARCRVIPFALPPLGQQPAATPPLPPGWSSEPFALFVGRFVYYKGLDVLLDALPSCPGLRVVLVGSGPLAPALQQQVRANGLEDRVAFLGTVGEPELAALYAACRFLVLPSTARSEAFGMVQLEAMAAGRPVISTNLPSGVPYVNQHQRTGLIVPPGSAAALARAMQTLLDDPALCARFGRAGRARVEHEFSGERVLGRWDELYAEIAGGA